MQANSETTGQFVTELAQLESLGFNKKSQNLKLLRRTNGNVDIVARFLSARKQLRESISQSKTSKKSIKEEIKQLKKKRENKDSDDEVKAQIKHLKKEKKRVQEDLKESKKNLKEEKKIFKSSEESDSSSEDEKALKKVQKKTEKEAKKLEKEQKKTLKKQEKAALKEQKKKEVQFFRQLPSEVNTVYLDGNNMLFVLGALRGRVLGRKMKEAEYILELMAKAWQSTTRIEMCTLIFDDTKTNRVENGFKVCSARPTFKTSDDALIQWSQAIPVSERSKVAIFTSDRALTESLQKIGVQVFKSKMWFNAAANALRTTEQPEDSINLDAWADSWLSVHYNKN
eukprot:TRINITY_DN463_c0_g1_i3.p1 TRINITY_DN463_c0_g1~~TRINITY_DN463_c0_g1_i3.p1  ORF type:complete len:341 (+),score=162.25 TRINITY_DN463_c0_g1_i3:148-1170(+)